jgi:PAS domain S-box-containing protein
MRSKAQLESTSDVISLVNVAGDLIYASASSAKLFGYLPEQVIGRNTLDLIHPEDRRSARHALLAVLVNPLVPRRIKVRCSTQ